MTTKSVVRVTVEGLVPPTVLVGRVALIVAFLVAEADHINHATSGCIEFNFDDHKFRPSIHEHFPYREVGS